MKYAYINTLFAFAFVIAAASPASAGRRNKLVVNGLGTASSITLSHSSGVTTADVNRNKATFTLQKYSNGVFSLLTGGQGAQTVVLAIKRGKKFITVKKAQKKGCTANDKAVVMLKNARKAKAKTAKRATVRVKLANGVPYVSNLARIKKALNKASATLVDVGSDCAPTGVDSLGAAGVSNRITSNVSISGTDPDADGIDNNVDPDDDNDGVADEFDVDDDGDGVLDNDDSDSNTNLDPDDIFQSFFMFSNFHLDFEDTVNLNASSFSQDTIDTRLRAANGLAIQVVGGDAFDVELDCGALTYCSEGGTGQTKEPFPNGVEFPEELDSDGDGLGTITPGSTGDFQLNTNADSDEIQSGDVLLQRIVDDEGDTNIVPGMVNFIFHTTPAVKTVETGGTGSPFTPTYPANAGDLGSSTNCFPVPASGDVSVTLTVWRPQRKGIAAAGEADFMDMGNLKISSTFPQGPCTPGINGVCNTNIAGPGNCSGSFYSTTDPNLTAVNDGLQDNLGDQPADASNTFTYTLDISGCLTDAGISWSPGEKFFFPLQMVNVFGDNTVQNICFIRESS